jgi:hypothetical protein
MKTTKTILVSLSLLWVVAPFEIIACWDDVPLETVIKQKPLVVVGGIIRVKTAPSSRYSYDIAFIKIERVLKNDGTNNLAEVGVEIPLAMPSTNNTVQISTDLRYRLGQRGVWILHFQDGKYWATYPKDFQNISEEPQIVAIIKKQASQRRLLRPTNRAGEGGAAVLRTF